jgi:hypothetical protein
MTTKADRAPGVGEDRPDSSDRPPSDADPDATSPKPLDDMPVPPLTEPADTSGG